LIVPGVVLTVVLGIVTAVGSVTTNRQSVTWQPRSVDEVQQTYAVDLGDVLLNLSAVDFSGGNYTVSVENQIGNLTVIVPAAVDVRAEVRVDVGNADVFGTQWAGIGQDTRTVTDEGADGPGGGTLVIHATTDVGNVEVRR
jgi:predicted membrane protein